jgi:hypothetical protein
MRRLSRQMNFSTSAAKASGWMLSLNRPAPPILVWILISPICTTPWWFALLWRAQKKVAADTAAARVMPGVTDIVEVASGVAVVAESFWQATQAASKVQVEWEETDLSRVDTATLRADYAAALDAGEGVEGPDEGDVQAAFAAGKYGKRSRLLGAPVIALANGAHECRRAYSG